MNDLLFYAIVWVSGFVIGFAIGRYEWARFDRMKRDQNAEIAQANLDWAKRNRRLNDEI